MMQDIGENVNDPYDLQRFVDAQQGVYDRVREELRQGRKSTHWMWFIFPQIAGLGHSAMAQRYAIASLDEARAYLAHPVLGPRLRECSGLVVQVQGRTIEEIFGYPDDLKFRSSMTLFAQAAEDREVFDQCLRKYFGGEPDAATLAQLNK
jgi:uncharacterized protein (DUF1810 family)